MPKWGKHDIYIYIYIYIVCKYLMTPQGHSIKKFEAMAFGMSEEERIIDRILRFFFFFGR